MASFDYDLARAMDRRAQLKAVNRCINAPFEDRPGVKGVIHGPPVPNSRGKLGVRCEYCVLVHRYGKDTARSIWIERQQTDPKPFGPIELLPESLAPAAATAEAPS